jgi:glycosyltransferase involved in cell wall biosynthesis
MSPLVSIVTPTYARPHFLQAAQRFVLSQTLTNFEWLVLDDSPAPDPMFAQPADPRIRYLYSASRLTIGEKRNRLVAEARGEFIAHFDDDDFYAPNYLESMVGALQQRQADVAHLCSWFLYDARHRFFGFWDLTTITGTHFLCHVDRLVVSNFTEHNNAHLRDNYLGYGFTYVYRKAVADAIRFPAQDLREDQGFIREAAGRFKLISLHDDRCSVLHVLHANSTSACAPQFRLPNFLLPAIFPEAAVLLSARQ